VPAALILLVVLGVPYVVFNLRRLYLGRRWAFTLWQAAKEWEERDRAKRLAARAAQPTQPAPSATQVPTTVRSRRA
jgi:hypothetical protein